MSMTLGSEEVQTILPPSIFVGSALSVERMARVVGFATSETTPNNLCITSTVSGIFSTKACSLKTPSSTHCALIAAPGLASSFTPSILPVERSITPGAFVDQVTVDPFQYFGRTRLASSAV